MAETNSGLPPKDLTGLDKRQAGERPKNLWGTLLRLWDMTRGNRGGFGMILVLAAACAVIAVLSPYLIGRIVSKVNGGDPIRIFVLCLASLYICEWLVKLSQQFLIASVGQKVVLNIRKTLFHKMQELPLSFFDRHQHGELMSRLGNDIDNISTTISNSLAMLLTYIFTILGILIVMLVLSPLLTLVSLMAVAAILALTRFITSHTKKLFLQQQKNLGILNGQVEESISGLPVVKAFCREEEMEEDFGEKNEQYCKVSIRAMIWSGYLMPLMNVINNLCFVAISVLSGVLFVRGVITDIGLVTSFLLYVQQFTRPFVEIANIYNNFLTAVAGAERVFEILDEDPEPEDRENAVRLPNPRGEFELRHVKFGYNPDKLVLNDLSLMVPAGTQVAIVGETGSGKTTIINLLTRFYDVTDGEILLDGHDLRDYKMADLRDAYGVVLQDTALFESSILDNIRFGAMEASLEEVREAARIAGADSFIERLPEAYDTVLTQGGLELSQGERQLLTIARAVLTNAPILILDEATSSVDTVTEQKIRHAMLKISENRTSFIIAHRLSTIRDSDMIILIDQGEIAEQGTHEELMARNGKYAQMYRTQTGGLDVA